MTASYVANTISNCEDSNLQRFTPPEASPLELCGYPDHTIIYTQSCDSPYRIDAATTATVYAYGIELTGEETAFRLRCERGSWFKVDLPAKPALQQ